MRTVLFLMFVLALNTLAIAGPTWRGMADPVLIMGEEQLLGGKTNDQRKNLANLMEAKSTVSRFLRALNSLDRKILKQTAPSLMNQFGSDVARIRSGTVGDAEQILAYGITSFKLSQDHKQLTIDVYVVVQTEGSSFVSDAMVELQAVDSAWKIESYQPIKK